ncbi:SpoIIE family protein phosphatase [Coraliomargarita algicola]|uniref:SpoIIE family protein phosphatase n=1 Tax=Coraliomargarita algicola TaxID=3092156 RepID=A0ABZ0RPA5_9BACT|nr:SpoIIE family protein phosphatase [Coraliomargarita sp. J2-16]WPJ96805.1 SpoIIE family protein phosphatase [Coraliomargarita sp. J2-16]
MHQETALYITEFTLTTDVKQVSTIRDRFVNFLSSQGLNESEKDGWKLVFTELVNNAIEHGSSAHPERKIYVRWWATMNSVWLETEDAGEGPPKEVIDNPCLPKDPLAEGGRGLFIIQEFADQFDHWYSSRGYMAKICKSYKRLNNVLPLNPEMDAILDELSDCYENLSLFDRMAANLLQDERIDQFVQSGLNMFMDARDYSAIHLELYQPNKNSIYQWISSIESYGLFGHINADALESLQLNDSINWSPKRRNCPFSHAETYPVGFCVPMYVGDEIVGLIAVGCEQEDHIILSNDIRNLRAFADIICVSVSRALLDIEKDARKRLATEMHIATELQQQLLPINKEIPQIPGYELFFSSLSALEVAGDFVEVRQNSAGEFLGCVIDVMGKGVSAAILAGIFRSQFIAYSFRGGLLATFIEGVNQSLESQLGGATMFITAFIFKINPESHEVTYAAAGHPPALLFHANGAMDELVSTGPPMGLFPDIEYGQKQIQIAPGDRLIAVTDGLYEWTEGDDIFGWDAMVDWFSANHHLDSEALWSRLQTKMLQSRESQSLEQEDDETLLILTRQ